MRGMRFDLGSTEATAAKECTSLSPVISGSKKICNSQTGKWSAKGHVQLNLPFTASPLNDVTCSVIVAAAIRSVQSRLPLLSVFSTGAVQCDIHDSA